MYKHEHTGAVVVLTVFAVVLAMASFTLPYYMVTDGRVTDSGWVRYSTIEFYPSFYDGDEVRTYSSGYDEIGALFDIVWALMWLWALGALVYISRIINTDESELQRWHAGFVAGWVLCVFAILPPLVFALLISGSFYASLDWVGPFPFDGFMGSTEYDEWGPMYGWALLAFACAIQLAAVLVRNIPEVLHSTKGPEEVPADVAARGDLPVR
ncbi:MAG TPA: hypothetical protein HA364_00745 [Thermoplasmata archaeon]|nr:hypothetical protein [Thermoplasmata archaeon]